MKLVRRYETSETRFSRENHENDIRNLQPKCPKAKGWTQKNINYINRRPFVQGWGLSFEKPALKKVPILWLLEE